ncbi:hypothetical protein SAMN06265795_101187 [Noviherbaspirillum humi]|uniref:Uncharacterized protein n=1 Tax=Noviherbaspirillum humi TaxID=1688639 RepID=A0A239C0B0_9BURK|nr:hypothetical protein [Noviherbaspirillum humi]SNS13560.1 hypothetical protein SAMN06265795_101187 [Noviherbaspirillum humi]
MTHSVNKPSTHPLIHSSTYSNNKVTNAGQPNNRPSLPQVNIPIDYQKTECQDAMVNFGLPLAVTLSSVAVTGGFGRSAVSAFRMGFSGLGTFLTKGAIVSGAATLWELTTMPLDKAAREFVDQCWKK